MQRFAPELADEEFIGLAEERIDAIERAAMSARDDLLAELDRMASADHEDELNMQRLRAARAELETQIDRLMALAERMRRDMQALGDGGAHGAPSAGVTLMVNQMAVLGRSEAEIVGMLAGFGVEDPRTVVREVLTGPPA